MKDYYDNYVCVYMHKTCGRGLHGLYSNDKRRRKFTRRFLAWYVNRSKDKPANITVGYNAANEQVTLIPGTYREGWHAYTAKEVICRRGRNKLTENHPKLYKEDDVIRYGITFNEETINIYGDYYHSNCFQRDGIPNNYEREAELYDDYCFSKNRKAWAIKHDKQVDWTKTYRDEIIKIAQDEYKRIKAHSEYERLPSSFKKYHDWRYRYFRCRDYDYFCLVGLASYHDSVKCEVIKDCSYSKNTAKNNARQLRALGFVA